MSIVRGVRHENERLIEQLKMKVELRTMSERFALRGQAKLSEMLPGDRISCCA